MAKKQGRSASNETDEPEDWPQIARFLVLAGAIVGVLLLGAALRTRAPAGSIPSPEAVEVERHLPAAEFDEFADPAEPEMPAETSLDRMARRTGADVERLAVSAEGWTAQIGVFCDPDHVEQLLTGFADEPALLILPAYHGDQPCFRLCWNRYGERERALRASDMPAALRDLLDGDPYPRRVTEVLE